MDRQIAGGEDGLWSAWLRHRAHSDDRGRQRQAEMLHRFRSRVLDGAAVTPGDVVLDAGCGDGLVGFGALERLGDDGTVVFSDISQGALDEAQTLAERLGVRERCRFLRSPTQALSAVPSETVDVVTGRSVLIYLDEADKRRAIEEFHRVLKPGGRLSLLEPVHSFWRDMDIAREACLGYGAAEMSDLAAKVNGEIGTGPEWDYWIDFTTEDLFALCMDAGFRDVDTTLDAHRHVVHQAESWETYLDSTPNPIARTLGEAMDEALTQDEQEEFTAYLKPKVEDEREPQERLEATVSVRAVKA